MLRRDFSKSNKEYFNQNKKSLIAIFVFIVVCVIVALIFGMNQNFELKQHYEFTVNVSSSQSKEFGDYSKDIRKIINEYGGEYDSYQVYSSGDNTKLVVRYMNELTDDDSTEVNEKIATTLDIDIIQISGHNYVDKIVKPMDYIYTVCAVLLLVVIASIFSLVRYNGASAITIICSSAFASLIFLCFSAILRLKIGMSYFAMIVALNILVIYFAIEIFENIKSGSWLAHDDYAEAISITMKEKKFRLCFVSLLIMFSGLLITIFAPSTLKYVSLNILFMSVVLLGTEFYVVPFIWSVFIPKCRINKAKIKVEAKVEN